MSLLGFHDSGVLLIRHDNFKIVPFRLRNFIQVINVHVDTNEVDNSTVPIKFNESEFYLARSDSDVVTTILEVRVNIIVLM